ncbi:MAG: winged helix-turn-helix domain-containing protein [Promethearchaeota archaeon]
MIINEKGEKNTEINNNQSVEDSYYYALGHELRRNIIKIIGENKYSSFTNLKKELKVSTGTIYHHLDTLSQLIEQRKDKKYYLTEIGIYAYNSLKDNIEIIEAPTTLDREFKSPILKALMFLTPKRFISFEKKDRIYNSIISLSILLIGAILCGLNGFYAFLLYYIETSEDIYKLEIIYHVFFSIGYIINFLIYFLLVEGMCRVFYGKKQKTLNFFLSFPIILYPMVIYLLVHFIFLSTELIQITIVQIFDVVLLVFFQIWSLWLLTYNISVNKELKIENGLIISLLLHYGSFTIVLFLSLNLF